VQIGAENKKQLRWMSGLLALAALAVLYDFRGLVNTASSSPQGTTTNAALLQRPDSRQIDQQAGLRPDLLLFNPQKTFKFGERNIFRMREIRIGSRKFPDTPVDPGRPQASPERPSPPLPFTFYGFVDKSNDSRRIFLLDNNGTFVTKMGDTIEGHYRVIKVSPNSVTIEDMLRNYQQLIPLLDR